MSNKKNNLTNMDNNLINLDKKHYSLLDSYVECQYSIQKTAILENKKLNDIERTEKIKELNATYTDKRQQKIKTALKNLALSLLSDNIEFYSDDFKGVISLDKLNLRGQLSNQELQYLYDNYIKFFLNNGKIVKGDKQFFLKGVRYYSTLDNAYVKYVNKDDFIGMVKSFKNINNDSVCYNSIKFDFSTSKCEVIKLTKVKNNNLFNLI